MNCRTVFPLRVTLAFFTALLALSARADTLSELKDHLSKLENKQPVRFAVEMEFAARDTDDAQAPLQRATIHAACAVDETGLKIQWPTEQLEMLTKETAGNPTDVDGPVARGMEALSANRLRDYLNGGTELLQNLGRAAVVNERDETLEGTPTRMLFLRITPVLTEKERKYVKELDATLRIWVGADGFPVAAESKVRVHGRAMLVVGFDSNESERFQFHRFGDRLVVVRHTREASSSGAGDNGFEKTVTTLTETH